MRWHEEKSWKDFHPAESSFIYSKLGFVNNPFRGMNYIKESLVPFLGGGECAVNNEVIYQKHPKLELIKNSKVLIIGGGPSTNQCEWDASKYDYVISCGCFFKNHRILEIPLFMVFLGDEVDFSEPELVDYLHKNETLVGFENVLRKPNELSEFKNRYKDRVFWTHTRYLSKIGTMARIISFISLLKPIEIHMVGMDGYVKKDLIDKHSHSFQNMKKPSGTFEKNKNEEIIIQKYEEQYLDFWDYVLHSIGKDISYKNLGDGHPCNISSRVLKNKLGSKYQQYLRNPKQRFEND